MAAKKSTTYVRLRVLETYREIYKGNEPDSEILKVNPNAYDVDPSPFYDALTSEFHLEGLLSKDKNAVFGGLGGTVAETIEVIASLWDGRSESTPGSPDGYNVIDLYFENVAASRKKPTESDLKTFLNMFKFELRSDYRTLKQQAQQALDKGHIDQIVELARKRKLNTLGASEIQKLLQLMISF